MAAQADETLTYTSAPLTSVYPITGGVALDSDFTVTVTLSTILGAGLNNVDESSLIKGLTFTTVQGGTTDVLTVSPSEAAGSVFDFTTNSSGQITGWDFTSGVLSPTGVMDPSKNTKAAPYEIIFHSCSSTDTKGDPACASGSYNSQNYGTTGDMYDYKPGSSSATDACSYNPADKCGTGGAGAVGTWTVAPELNTSSAGAGLTLFFGILAVMIGRRRASLAAAI